ncbi:MAG: T9SS type A sorting domain-containing protein [Candidatus Zixiibacteriota bacterium]
MGKSTVSISHLRSLLVALVLVFEWTTPTLAATIHVPADQPTIQAGINVAVDGDTVLLADGTYTGDGNRDVSFLGKKIVVTSEHGPGFTIIDCEGTPDIPHRAFVAVNGEDTSTVISGIAIIGGEASLFSTIGSRYGGALYVSNAGLKIDNCCIEYCSAEFGGGLGMGPGAIVMVNRSTFRYNTCTSLGGAIACYGYPGGAMLSLIGVVISHCIAGHAAGGLYLESTTFSLDRTVLYANWGVDEAGAGMCFDSKIVINSSTIAHNSGGGTRDAFTFANDTLIISNSLISHHEGDSAIGIAGTKNVVLIECTNIFSTAGFGWPDSLAGYYGTNGNISEDPAFCELNTGNLTVYDNSPCLPGNNQCATLIGALDVGCVSTGIDNDNPALLPERVALLQNYPNPFNPSTTIRFFLSTRSFVIVEIFNVLGQRIANLVSVEFPSGEHDVLWNGQSDAGVASPSGVYLCRLRANGVTLSRKLVLAK